MIRHPQTNRWVLLVDFDGTLCENMWPGIGRPNTELIATLLTLQRREDVEIHLYTSRTGERLLEAKQWCRRQGLHFTTATGGKPWASAYIDDKNLNPINQPVSRLLEGSIT